MLNSFSTRSILIYHLPMILYAGAIIAVSSIPNLTTPELKLIAFDKLAHFVEYAIFAALTYRSLSHMGQKVNPQRALIFSFLVVALMALIDESYQRLIPGRVADGLDYIVDLLGAFGVLIYLWIKRRQKVVGSGPD
jgi:VanZ family protein